MKDVNKFDEIYYEFLNEFNDTHKPYITKVREILKKGAIPSEQEQLLAIKEGMGIGVLVNAGIQPSKRVRDEALKVKEKKNHNRKSPVKGFNGKLI